MLKGKRFHFTHLSLVNQSIPSLFPSMKCRSTAVRIEDTPQSPLPVAGPWQHVQLKWEGSSTIIDLGGGRARIQTNVSIHVGFHSHTGSCVCLFVIKLRLTSKLPLFLPQPLSVGNTCATVPNPCLMPKPTPAASHKLLIRRRRHSNSQVLEEPPW